MVHHFAEVLVKSKSGVVNENVQKVWRLIDEENLQNLNLGKFITIK